MLSFQNAKQLFNKQTGKEILELIIDGKTVWQKVTTMFKISVSPVTVTYNRYTDTPEDNYWSHDGEEILVSSTIDSTGSSITYNCESSKGVNSCYEVIVESDGIVNITVKSMPMAGSEIITITGTVEDGDYEGAVAQTQLKIRCEEW